MTTLMQYQLEQTGQSATMYIGGDLTLDDTAALVAVCDSLPATTRTLRLDLHAIGMLSAEGTDVVRRLLRHWRLSRRGEFRLSTSYLTAVLRGA